MNHLEETEQHCCDVLIVGGGGAGLRAAIEARQRGADVMVVSKTNAGYGNNTFISKSNIAASGWGAKEDNHEVHMEDTLKGGCFLNDRGLLSIMTREAGRQISFLRKCGVSLAEQDGKPRVRHVPGHTYPRHVSGINWTGSDLAIPLKQHAERSGVRFTNRVFVTRIFTSENIVTGAAGISRDGKIHLFKAACVVLATGGYSNIFLHTNNAAGITGDGQALAYELGLPLMDMEFVQFYPTATGKSGSRILLYESFLFHGGATLKNSLGENILEKHGLNDSKLATRDRMAQAIMQEIIEGLDVNGSVIMDLSSMPEDRADQFHSLLPGSFAKGIRSFPVSPTTHFCMGGVVIETNAETKVSGLFAAGEVCAGVHGANRLSGNALAEIFTIGYVAGKNAAHKALGTKSTNMAQDQIEDEKQRIRGLVSPSGMDISLLRKRLRTLIWRNAGIVRNSEMLERALAEIGEIIDLSKESRVSNPKELIRLLELTNMLTVAEIVCRSALLRTESRGSHFRSDFPREDNENWLANLIASKAEEGPDFKKIPCLIRPD